MKKLFTIILCLCIVLALPMTAMADKSDTDIPYAVTGGNIYFNKITGSITDCDSSVTNAVIPETIDGVDVTSIAYRAFFYNERLLSVSLPSSITDIGDEAFSYCKLLTNINIPNGVKSIGYRAFYRCYKLLGLSLPNSLTYIGSAAFEECESLTKVDIPAGVTYIFPDTFYKCISLQIVTIPYGVNSIGDSAFWFCKSLQSINIPDSVTSIGRFAFSDCLSATSLKLSNSITALDAAFTGCKSLTTVVIPKGVTTLKDAFDGCSSLTSIALPDSLIINDTIHAAWSYYYNTTFDNCSWLSDVYYGGTIQQWGTVKYGNTSGLQNATIHYNSYEEGVALCTSTVSGFEDVFSGSYFADAVNWAKGSRVTIGVTENEFAPFNTVTRGQAVTFLWRAKGCPEPSTTNNPFIDVSTNDYFYKAVLWAVENSITAGTDARHFSPSDTCTTGHMVTFLWRTIGAPDYTGKGSWYTDAMNWAKNSSVMVVQKSYSDDCPRADVVYYLWKALN